MSHGEPLPDTIGYLLAQVCKLHRQRAGELLGEIGLHVGQEMMLCALWDREGITQTELAEHLRLRPATVTNALKRMERNGFVERRQDIEDQRVSRVYVTEKGCSIKGAIQEKWNQLEEESFAALSGEEHLLLRRLLRQIYDNLLGEA